MATDRDDEQGGAKSVPTSWLGRSLRLAATTAGVAARSAGGSLRRMAGSRDAADNAAADNARALLSTMGHLKGVALKVGQMFSYMDNGMPEPARRVLSALQNSAPAMAPPVIERVIATELGARPSELFAEWSPTPFAAASIGQVHRARLRDGSLVAVKVQYPGIAEAFRADLRNVHLAGTLGGLLLSSVDMRGVVEEVRERLMEECDYRQEAANQEHFRALHAGDPHIRVPRVVRELSTARVLTTDLMEGAGFEQFLAGATRQACNSAGVAIYRMAFESIFRHHVFNCDPHPGNYLFRDGEVVFLDFGCVKRFDPEFVARWRRMIRATLDEDRPEFDRVIVESGIALSPKKFDFDYHFKVSQYLYRPWATTQPFVYTPEYIAESYRLMVIDNPNRTRANMPRDFVFVNRLQWGLNSVLASLRAEADWRSMMLPLLD